MVIYTLCKGSWARLGSRALGPKSSKARALENTGFLQGLAPTTKSRHVEGGGNRACVILISRGEQSERALHPATRDPTPEYWISIEFRGRVNRQNRWTTGRPTDNMGDDVLKEETIIPPFLLPRIKSHYIKPKGACSYDVHNMCG